MPRSVNAVASRRRRKKILKAARGYFGARSKVYTVAKNAVDRAMAFSYRDRKAIVEETVTVVVEQPAPEPVKVTVQPKRAIGIAGITSAIRSSGVKLSIQY